jgi:DNA-binding CsgD family transcriptional regulator
MGSKQNDPINADGQPAEQGSSSLHLLEKLIEVGGNPELLPELSRRWAVSPESTQALTGYDSVLSAVFAGDSPQETTLAEPADTLLADSYSFTMSPKYDVQSVSEKLSDILPLKPGESVQEIFKECLRTLVRESQGRGVKEVYTDIIDSSNMRHMVKVVPVISGLERFDGYTVTLCKQRIPAAAESYIRHKLQLTNTEIDILQLLLQRFDLQQIADYRKSTLNTTRTHINNIKRKFNSRKLSDVLISVSEIISAHEAVEHARVDYADRFMPVRHHTKIVHLRTGGWQVEYSRYGDAGATPMVILHSLEYGAAPSPDFISAAIAAGYCLYVPYRPGYGRTTAAPYIRKAAEMMTEFLSVMKLTDVTLVALSMAVPTAVNMVDLSKRISKLWIVNYAFDVEDKISKIKPVWVRGMLDLGLRSKASGKYTLNAAKGLIRIIGPMKFFRKIYESCAEDLSYVVSHEANMEICGELLLSSKLEAVRNDLQSALTANPQLIPLFKKYYASMSAIYGQSSHGVSSKPAQEAAANLGIGFHTMQKGGRNCIYHRPETFFQIIEEGAALGIAAQ